MKHKDRSVENDVRGFCGWQFLGRVINEAEDQEKGLVVALFETGGRVSEVIKLRKRHFYLELNPEVIVVDAMPVVKKYEKISEIPDPKKKRGVRWVTQKKADSRTIPIKKTDPLVPYLVNHYNKAKDYLFPSMSRVEAFLIVRNIGKRMGDDIVPFSSIKTSQLYPHWFRAQRASQLKSEYNFDLLALASFFRWKLPGMGATPLYTYLSWEEMARRMGVKI